MEAGVDSRARARGRENRPVLDEQSILHDVDLGVRLSKFVRVAPMSRSRLSLQYPGGRESEYTGADGDDTGTPLGGRPQYFQVFLRDRAKWSLVARNNDDIGVFGIGRRVSRANLRGRIVVSADKYAIARVPAEYMRRDADVQRIGPRHREDRDDRVRTFGSQ
ncbi:hypothetical protein GCM10023323_18470 [Streptomyces thinghirensis]|uniref:Uncharacterized protein n=1 Tax=Streptomyces thinghirensis TaxID=551547 RepID=A0ABP9SYE6_9ACTN